MKRTTQTYIAKKVGISDAFLSQVLSGIRRPSWQIAKKLSKATKTDIAIWMEAPPNELRKAVKDAALSNEME